MRVDIIGGGPAGLFLAGLLRRDGFVDDVRLYERNEPDDSAGWAVVFPEGSLDQLSKVDRGVFEGIERAGMSWTEVEIRCRDSRYLVEGNRFHGIGRDRLLSVLRERAVELGVQIHYGHQVTDLAEHADADLVVGADGLNSVVRAAHAEQFGPRVEHGEFWYGWFGIEVAQPTFAYIFVETEWGLFQGYVYPSGQSWSSLIIYVSEDTWQRSGLAGMDVDESLRFCERVFADHFDGKPIQRRGPGWTRFRHLRCDSWHTDDVVLIGDAAHTAHWSIGSGTRLAIEDAIALADQLRAQPTDIPDALATYEKVRRQRVEQFQDAALLSERYFDTVRRYLDFEPIQFAYQLVARSWRITFADIAKRDPDFIRRFNAWFHSRATGQPVDIAPSPVFAPTSIGGLRLANRIVTTVPTAGAGLVLGAPAGAGQAAAALVGADGLEAALAAAQADHQLALLDLTARPVADLLADPPTADLARLRAHWPADRPVGAALGLAAGCDAAADTAVELARVLAGAGLDVVLLGPAAEDPPSRPGQVVQVADAVRNETGLAVIADDGLRTLDAADTAVAAGRADLCVLRFESSEGEAR
ncbi:FAD-dependent monooxygenase [Actinokineospora sp. NPDC004072]